MTKPTIDGLRIMMVAATYDLLVDKGLPETQAREAFTAKYGRPPESVTVLREAAHTLHDDETGEDFDVPEMCAILVEGERPS